MKRQKNTLQILLSQKYLAWMLLAVVVLAIITIKSEFQSESKEPERSQIVYSENKSIQTEVQSCVNEGSLRGVREFGMRGGFPDIPSHLPGLVTYDGMTIGTYRYGRYVYTLRILTYEESLNGMISFWTGECLKNLYPKMSLAPLPHRVQTTISPSGISILAEVQVKIEENYLKPQYSYSVNVTLIPFIKEAQDWALENPSQLAERDLRIDAMKSKGWSPKLIHADQGLTIVRIEDSSHQLEGRPFVFQFAIIN